MEIENHGYKFSMKLILKFMAVFLLTLMFTSLLSCTNGMDIISKNEEITVLLPVFPDSPGYPQLSRWLIHIEAKEISESFFISESFQLSLLKNEPVSITATAITYTGDNQDETVFFKPAGAVYPYEWNEDEIQLTWEGGFAASLMESIFKSCRENHISSSHMNDFISSFNWEKLQTAVINNINKSIESFLTDDETVQAKFYNPWQIDRQKLLENLTNKIFSADYLKTKNVYSVNLSLFGFSSEISVISSFIPENEILLNYDAVSLQKNVAENFLISERHGVSAENAGGSTNTNTDYILRVTCASAKKVSLEVVNLPIFIEEYVY